MLSKMKNVAVRQKRSSFRDALAGAAIVLLISVQAFAFSSFTGESADAVVVEPVPTQQDNPIDPDNLICTPESIAVVC